LLYLRDTIVKTTNVGIEPGVVDELHNVRKGIAEVSKGKPKLLDGQDNMMSPSGADTKLGHLERTATEPRDKVTL